MAKSYTQRTLAHLRKLGLKAGVVERWLQSVHRGGGQFGIRQDLFGWIDVIALEAGKNVLGIQSTSWGQKAAHKRKLREERASEVVAWLGSGARGELWCWRKVKNRWQVERTDLSEMFEFLA